MEIVRQYWSNFGKYYVQVKARLLNNRCGI